MRRLIGRLGWRSGLVLAGTLIATGGIAYAASSGSPSVYTACKLNATGTIRLIDPGLGASSLLGHCTSFETQISWNAQGPAGPAGPAGPVGPAGAQGQKGDTGAAGPQGVKGDTGATGPQGAQGLKGDTGATGPQGAQGLKGDTGATGPQGVKGDTGPQGLKGDTGAQGLPGLKGDTGATGAQGLPGLKGDTGATGAQGPQGPAGQSSLAGLQGSPCTFNDLPSTVGVSVNNTSGAVSIVCTPVVSVSGTIGAFTDQVTFTVSGTTVSIRSSTVISGSGGPIGLADLKVGDAVFVIGVLQADLSVVAQSVRRT